MSGCQAVKFILALKNLGIWQVLCFQLFPAVSVHSGSWQFCAFSSFSFCNQESELVPSCQAVKFVLALKNLGIWQVLCFQLFPAVSVHSGLWQALCFQL